MSKGLPCQREVPSVSEAEGFPPGCGGTACRARPVRIPPAAFGVHLPLTREAFLRLTRGRAAMARLRAGHARPLQSGYYKVEGIKNPTTGGGGINNFSCN